MRKHKEKMRVLIQHAIADGWSIVDGDWADQSELECCALGACLVISDIEVDDHEPEQQAAAFFGVPVESIYSFVSGFDGARRETEINDHDSYLLGQEFRAEFVRSAK